MTSPRQYRPNTALLQLESACTELLRLSLPQKTEHFQRYLDEIRRDLENHGDETFFVIEESRTRRNTVHVLALDLAWLRPGPIGGWSENGMQAYCWRKRGASARRSHTSWYARALEEFFSGPNASSLLSLKDIYSQEKWVRWDWIAQPGLRRWGHQTRLSARNRGQDFGFDIRMFRPRTDPLQKPSDWKTRFDKYRETLRRAIESEFGAAASKCVLLMCVYVSPGSPRPDQPPNWAASLFVVLELPAAPEGAGLRRLGAMISNIYNCLNTAAHRALEAQREQRNLAQAISHEFKNLNQAVAVLAAAARDDLRSLPQSVRVRLAPLESRLDVLHTTARATTSFCHGTHWLFSVKDVPKTTTKTDDKCYLFRHIMALGIHLIAPSKRNWNLVGLPSEESIIKVLSRHFAVPSSSGLADLVLQPAVAIMLFLALEPIRNIKGDSGAGPIQIGLLHRGNKLTLVETSLASHQHSLKRVKSEAVEILMQALADYCPWKLIEVDPWTDIKSLSTQRSGQWRIVKTTSITVHNVIVGIVPREPTAERQT